VVVEFEVAAGFEVVVGLLDEARPVGEAGDHGARKDQVEGRGVGPVFFDVVADETAVGGNAESEVMQSASADKRFGLGNKRDSQGGLDGAQIHTDDLGLGM